MATDFATALRRFLTSYLAGLRGCSPATIASYRDTFKLLIAWFRDERQVPPARLTLDHVDARAVTAFLAHLQEHRGNSVSTRNQRLAAISSFSTWMQTEDPVRMAAWQDIAAIPVKKQDHPAVSHLTTEQTRRLLAAPDRSTRQGRRDATLLATLYDTGARVSELADLTVRGIRPQNPAIASLTGKGRKTRHVPLAGNTVALLAAYLAEHRLDQPGRDGHPLFFNQHRAKLSRGGIAWIISKYHSQAADPPSAGRGISPHVLRHSKVICTASDSARYVSDVA
jgi:site-specific recombinase XerD